MAAMASPRPDPAVLEPEPRQPILEGDSKADINGHVASAKPSTELPPILEPPVVTAAAPVSDYLPELRPEPVDEPKLDADKPLANGDELRAHANGITSGDIKMGNGDDHHDVAESSAAKDDKEDKIPEIQKEDEQTPLGKSDLPESSSQPAPLPAEDVDMTDAPKPAENVAPAPATEPSRESESLPAAEPAVTSVPTSAPVPESAPEAETPATTEDKPEEKPIMEKPEGEKAPVVETEMTDKPKEAEHAEHALAPSQDTTLPSSSDVDLHPNSMSQLAIETQDTSTSPVTTSVEVSMSEAPAVKVAREREEDASEEPAPKRAKTETEEEGETIVATGTVAPQASTAEASADAEAASTSAEVTVAGEAPALNTLPQWEVVEVDARPITPYRRREIRKVLARVKKTKSGALFRDSVQKLWAHLWDAYVAKIERPMDLAELERLLRDPDSIHKTVGDFRKDLGLIFENTLAFNGPTHDVTLAAAAAIKSTWNDVREIPDEEPVKPKAAPKPKPVRESRTQANAEAAARRQSAGPAAAATGEAIEAKSQPEGADQSAEVRRASTATEGDRPKRTVRAPKPKDIDYSTKPSRKKLKPELQFCDEVLTELMHPKHTDYNTWFLDPVDAEGLNIPQYYSMIKKPMDLNKVLRMISSGEIASLKDFEKNVKLIFTNCYTFNGPISGGNPVSLACKGLEDLFNSLMKNKDAWLAKHAKSNARAAAASADSDEDDEDDEGEDDDAAAPAVDPSKEVRELEAKLREESEKLTNLYTSKDPNPSMIDIQQGILKMVQEALLKAKQNQNDFRQKQDKPGKKAGKSGKAKAAGGGGGRKSTGGGGAQPKKAGGSKKATKKTLTAADKDQIANAINDLEYGHLERAIDIIKRDTGQAENNEGELELDIDQLSNDALLKLWELCKKVLPGFGKGSAGGSNAASQVNDGASAKQAHKSASKPKKSKPMSAQEQEARIAQLRGLSELYKPGQEPGDSMTAASYATPAQEMGDSSDESSSEEE